MINYRLLCIVSLLVFAFAGLGLLGLDIDTDVVRSLPTGEKVIADGLDIFEHHPVHDQIAVDISIAGDDPDTLVAVGSFLEQKMEASGLFAQVGTDAIGEQIPELAFHAAQNLPLLFIQPELEQKVAPLLTPERINTRLQELYVELSSMEGIGQARFIGLDPLGLKDLILAKLAPLAPSLNSRFYKGKLLSADGQHLLVTARPLATGTNTASARKISDLFSQSSRELTEKYGSSGQQVTLTPVGAFRAALDNERIIRHDVQLALLLATLGIGLLLLFSFPRPLIGLLSLVPALAGTSAALFVYSLFNSSISIMVLGFGGAIISITVDHGIAYLLFLDRPHESKGKEASHEVRAIGIMAVITSIGAFLILSWSGFPIFTELGRFTALGILFAFLFVHFVFPRIFPHMPAGSDRVLPLRILVDAFYNTGKPGAIAAVLLFCGLLFFASPRFYVSLSSMNTVSDATLQADALFTEVWGAMDERVFLMHSAATSTALQQEDDQLLAMIEEDVEQGILAPSFVPSMIFPGRERAGRNVQAWHDFWDSTRVTEVKETLLAAGAAQGFTPDAFADFFALLDPAFSRDAQPVPSKYYTLLGITEDGKGMENNGKAELIQFVTVVPGGNYNAPAFLSRYGEKNRVFDANYFTERLADILFSTFTTMLIIVALSVALLLFFFFLDLPLTLLTLLPPFFAYVCTLGTLRIIGHPLDIPALMLSVVILGMGIDYSIFCVRAHQRYRDRTHPSFALVRVAVFMAASSTLIGFGVLALAEHSLLRSIGITSLLGIGYSLLGTFLLLPPLLHWYFGRETGPDHAPLIRRIRRRFQTLEAYPRMFARFKLQYDPMFTDLPRMFAGREHIKTIVDIGCGYGVPACWCLEQYRGAEVFAIDPDPERVRVAALATGGQGTVAQGWAAEFPTISQPADVVLLLDMLHYLDDETVAAVFKQSFAALASGGILVARFVIRPPGRLSWSWHLEDIRIRLSGYTAWYRSAAKMAELMEKAGFVLLVNEITATNPELVWMVGQRIEERIDAGQAQ